MAATVQEEEQQNEQLLQLSNQILELYQGYPRHEQRPVATGSNGTEQAASSSLGDAVGQRFADQELWQRAI